MRFVDIAIAEGSSARSVSVLGFGCASVMGRAGRKVSETALGGALDAGINFFDTARSYGYGEAEALMGEFFAGRRQEVVLCTKFGILPAPRGWKHRFKPLAQAAVQAFPSLRAALKRGVGKDAFVPGQFSVEVLQQSFETSLRKLRTDYVDLLLLHAAPKSVLQQDDLLEAMARLVEQGKVLMAGISGELDVLAATFQNRPPVLRTAQGAINRSTLGFTSKTRQAAGPSMVFVANHPFGGPSGIEATCARITALHTSPNLPSALREKLDTQDPQLFSEVMLNVLLDDTGVSAVIPTMMRPSSLQRNVQAIDSCRFTSEELKQIREELILRP